MESGPGVSYWLSCSATSRKVPGYIPGRVTGDFFAKLPTSNVHANANARLALTVTRNDLETVSAIRRASHDDDV